MSEVAAVARRPALVPASFAADRAGLRPRDFALIAIQLLLILLLLRQFQIEGRAFVEVAALSFAGFAVHAYLPLRWRLPFFAAFSLCAMAFVLGGTNTLWIAAIGAVLVGICHLPIAARWRTCLLLAAAALLIAQRSGAVPFPWSEAIWPILGSMFMFRLIVYYYDVRHDKAPVSPAETVSYFAMLPQACFPLFPVVDFKTYRRSHYAQDAYATYQRGVDWIVRGIVHLILYRYFYYYVTLTPSEVATPADLAQYLVANFMLYLRVSGLFHLIVGMLLLFGFNLPETHNRYLLASSFTDFWRRINIYWKDFMQKIFYFPAVFALKKLGTTRAIIVATMYVFLLTWFLHSYQWFWLRGSWLFAPQDVLFWTVLGMLVVANSLYEIRFGRKRSVGGQAWSPRAVAMTVLQTYATFWFICVLWSFWTTETIGAWLALWSALKGPFTLEFLLFPALSLAVIVVGTLPRVREEAARDADLAPRLLRRERAVSFAVILALLAISVEGVHTRLGSTVATTIHALRSAQLSRIDNAKLERGYYEGLLDVGRFNSQLWEVYTKKPANWLATDFTGLKRFTGDFAQTELAPLMTSNSRYGPITTNRFGLRDKDYADKRAPGTLRIAVLGPSTVMGWGVGDGDTFESLLEDRLAREPLPTGFATVEILNYGVPGYQPPQELVSFDRALLREPNALFYTATGRELHRSAGYLAEVVRKRVAIPYPELRAIVAESGAQPEMSETELERRLAPFAGRILEYVYRTIAERCRELRIAAVWVFLPQVRPGTWQEETPEAERLARAAGFVVMNLQDVYSARPVEEVRLAEWDEHPNRLGHRLVADRLYTEIATRGSAMFDNAAR